MSARNDVLRVVLKSEKCKKLNTRYKPYSAYLVGRPEPLAHRVRDPEHDACRALLALGYTGRVRFYHGITHSMTLDIATAAGRKVVEGERDSPYLGRWQPYATKAA